MNLKRRQTPKGKKYPFTVAIDLDNTLASYQQWHGEDMIGNPLEGAVEAVHTMHGWGWKLVVFSVRESPHGQVQEWLAKHFPEIPIDYSHRKPIAHVYVDDRGLRFYGDWKQTLFELGIMRKGLTPAVEEVLIGTSQGAFTGEPGSAEDDPDVPDDEG